MATTVIGVASPVGNAAEERGAEDPCVIPLLVANRNDGHALIAISENALHQRNKSPVSDAALSKATITSVVSAAENDMDFLLTSLGSPGRYQVLLFGALISCMIPVVLSDLCGVFYGISPVEIVCNGNLDDLETISVSSYGNESADMDASNSNQSFTDFNVLDFVAASSQPGFTWSPENGSCDVYRSVIPKCLNISYIFEYPWVWTIVSEWNLFCDQKWMNNFATTIYFLGVMTGSIAFGTLADRFGRRSCIISCYIGYLPLSFGIAFVPWYSLYAVLRFFIGFFIQGLQSVCFVLLMEYCSPKYREIIGGLEGIVANFGIMLLSGMSYWWGKWQHIQIVITLPTLIALCKIAFLRESLRWQMVHGKTRKAKQSVIKILQWNRSPPDGHLEDVLDQISEALKAEENVEKGYSWLDCFRTPNMRKRTILQCFMWFTALFVYYGISFGIGDLGGNIYLNTFASSFAEFPAAGMAIFTMTKYGRKRPLLVYYCLCSLFCCTAGFLTFINPSDASVSVVNLEIVRTVVVFVGRFFIAATFGILFVYGSELFPTVLRNTAFGLCLACHTSGGVIAPQVLLLGDTIHRSAPFFIFASCALISAVYTLLLPETWRTRMPDTIEEIEHVPVVPDCDIPKDAKPL